MSSATLTADERLAYARLQVLAATTDWGRRHWTNEVVRIEAEVALEACDGYWE